MEPEDPIPLSALEHWSYCPRQCCLIHAEQAFAENIHTLRGQAVHARTDEPGVEAGYEGRRIARAVPLWCDRLGLVGKSDVVEFLPDGTPYPVEYKHGRKREKRHDDIQLAAQAMCLEEMTGKPVPFGAIYHASSRRRREVAIAVELRQAVETCVAEVRAALQGLTLPPPVNDKRCRECSLAELCQPALLAEQERRSRLAKTLFEPKGEGA
ncbi:MAG: CRISPR-associated protein Cas4 [Betaproteobacteria bacterium HGW-Betaproteobacteria-14]|nr:MAG: CRISPR-associated protein Cas4 [Betaproteobacteria bacterium HGW-Betaproteobacteria-14]PKO91154.1 MAG: CRISPR-associated protein Cas4 [Betaproteobacteria bacterium HGW-Betaproteobacteria-10]